MLPSAWQTSRLHVRDAGAADRDDCHACLVESHDVAALDPAFETVPAAAIETLIGRSLKAADTPGRSFQMQVFRLATTGQVVGYWHFMVVPTCPAAVGVSIMLVRPAFRRQGLGREVVAAAADRFGASTRELWARVYLANPRAIEFWARLGFLRLAPLHGAYVAAGDNAPSIILSRLLGERPP